MYIIFIVIALTKKLAQNNFAVYCACSIFNKSNQVSAESRDTPKGLHLLDDSEIEDINNLIASNMPTPTDESLQASRSTNEDSALLTR